MGWASGDEVFDSVARAVLAAEGSTLQDMVDVLYALADALRDADWDTLDDSISVFKGEPVVVLALRMAQGEIELDSATGDAATVEYYGAMRHWVLHRHGHEPLTRPGTWDGFNDLLRTWARMTDNAEDYETAIGLMIA